MPCGIGVTELVILLVALLIIFGPKRLPEMGRSLGRGLREFKSSVTSDEEKALDVPEAAIAEPVSFAHVSDDVDEPATVARLETRPIKAEQHVA